MTSLCQVVFLKHLTHRACWNTPHTYARFCYMQILFWFVLVRFPGCTRTSVLISDFMPISEGYQRGRRRHCSINQSPCTVLATIRSRPCICLWLSGLHPTAMSTLTEWFVIAYWGIVSVLACISTHFATYTCSTDKHDRICCNGHTAWTAWTLLKSIVK